MEQHVARSSATDGLAAAALDDVHERFLRLAGSGMDRAYRLAGLVLGDGTEAEDAVQDALLRAWDAAATLRDPAGFEAWFDRILVDGCRDRLRRRKVLRFIPIDASHDTVPVRDAFGAIGERDAILAGLHALQPDDRVVVVLHYWADLRLEDIAARLDCPTGTVKSRLHRAKAVLRDRLGASADEVQR
jgi:RNA polymerase sigma factor (sigma-70 family)